MRKPPQVIRPVQHGRVHTTRVTKTHPSRVPRVPSTVVTVQSTRAEFDDSTVHSDNNKNRSNNNKRSKPQARGVTIASDLFAHQRDNSNRNMSRQTNRMRYAKASNTQQLQREGDDDDDDITGIDNDDDIIESDSDLSARGTAVSSQTQPTQNIHRAHSTTTHNVNNANVSTNHISNSSVNSDDPMAVFFSAAFPSPSKFDEMMMQAGGLPEMSRQHVRRRGNQPSLMLPLSISRRR
uniref:Uncharacterized protein n=1 Tax=Lygus hesperus TaxID=30085 RepID=A0A0A9XJY9_LYGHE